MGDLAGPAGPTRPSRPGVVASQHSLTASLVHSSAALVCRAAAAAARPFFCRPRSRVALQRRGPLTGVPALGGVGGWSCTTRLHIIRLVSWSRSMCWLALDRVVEH